MMIGVSLSRAKMHVIATAIKLDRSKFVKQFKMIGMLDIFRAVIMSMMFCATPIMFAIVLKMQFELNVVLTHLTRFDFKISKS